MPDIPVTIELDQRQQEALERLAKSEQIGVAQVIGVILQHITKGVERSASHERLTVIHIFGEAHL